MRTTTILFALAVTAFMAEAALAATQTVALDVPGMTCELCPLTIRKALQKVPGVEKVEASYPKKEAIVTFDDAKTSDEALLKAIKEAGFPATVKTGASR